MKDWKLAGALQRPKGMTLLGIRIRRSEKRSVVRGWLELRLRLVVGKVFVGRRRRRIVRLRRLIRIRLRSPPAKVGVRSATSDGSCSTGRPYAHARWSGGAYLAEDFERGGVIVADESSHSLLMRVEGRHAERGQEE
jgi:hypothetical protein